MPYGYGGGYGGPPSLYQMAFQPPPPRAWWQNYLPPQGNRSDQNYRGNKSDPGNAMAPYGPAGGPDNAPPMNPYDPATVSRRQQMQQAMQMGQRGLSMLQPRQPMHTGPYPWI